jgi:hypothetical protein
MKTDSSWILYKHYYQLKNPILKIELKNHLIITGKIIGFYRGTTTYISKWEIAETNQLLGTDHFGDIIGQVINHKDIAKIEFLDDASVLNFTH